MARWLSWLVVLAVACNGSDTVVLEERGPVVPEAGAPEGSAGLADVGPRTPQDARSDAPLTSDARQSRGDSRADAAPIIPIDAGHDAAPIIPADGGHDACRPISDPCTIKTCGESLPDGCGGTINCAASVPCTTSPQSCGLGHQTCIIPPEGLEQGCVDIDGAWGCWYSCSSLSERNDCPRVGAGLTCQFVTGVWWCLPGDAG